MTCALMYALQLERRLVPHVEILLDSTHAFGTASSVSHANVHKPLRRLLPVFLKSCDAIRFLLEPPFCRQFGR